MTYIKRGDCVICGSCGFRFGAEHGETCPRCCPQMEWVKQEDRVLRLEGTEYIIVEHDPGIYALSEVDHRSFVLQWSNSLVALQRLAEARSLINE